LLDDPKQRAAHVARGRRYVEDHLGWDRIAETTQDLYRLVVRRERYPARRLRERAA
jgi:glycosyltransferase involved in cell wall biosynthesis